MAENTTIWYRGASYELGRGLSFYGIWSAGGGQWHPFEWWPLTPEGWAGAWARFTAIEAPTAIIQLSTPRSGEPGAGSPAPLADALSTAAPSDSGAAAAEAAEPLRPAGQAAGLAGQPGLAADAEASPAAHAQAGPAADPQASVAADACEATADAQASRAADGQASQPAGPGQEGPAGADGRQLTDAAGLGSPPGSVPGHNAAAARDDRRNAPGGLLASLRSQARMETLTRRPAAAAAVLLTALGVALGIAGLFPDYYAGNQSLVAQAANLVPHVVYLAGWTAAAVLILAGGSRQRAGALLGLGLGAVTFGLFFADAGFPIAGQGSAGTGLTLSIAGWAVATAGSAVALWQPARSGPVSPAAAQAARSPWAPQQPAPARLAYGQAARWRRGGWLSAGWSSGQRAEPGPAVALVLAAILTAIAFVPAWNAETLHTTIGFTQTSTQGNAFASPGPVIAGNVAVIVALVAAAIAAALWRPVRQGVALAAGAAIPMVAQGIAAVIVRAGPPPASNVPPAQARQIGLTVSNGLTAWFWVYCIFLAALLLSLAWMLIATGPVASRPAAPGLPGWQSSAPGPQGFAAAGPVPASAPWRPSAADRVPSTAAQGQQWPAQPGGYEAAVPGSERTP